MHNPDKQESEEGNKNDIKVVTDGIDNNTATGRFFEKAK